MRPVFIKLAKYISGISFLFISLISNPVYAYNCTNWVAKLQSAQGSVQVRQENKQWLQVQRNATFCKGDVLRVQENSRAALLLRNDTLLRLNQNTTITFTNLTPDKPSVVSVSTGFAHFISRVKAAFEVITPFINAAIEGTEFVVAVNKGNAEVTVFEGTVRAYNKHGEVRLTSNQTAQAKKGQAPVLILKAKPRDAVNWSLYYPLIIAPNADSITKQASLKLSVGQVDTAKNLLQKAISNNANNSEALAMLAVISIVQNNKEAGLELAQQAVAADNTNITAKLALSYAQQAHFNVGAALKTLQTATQNSDGTETGNALIWSRLAEVYLMHGELDNALTAAKKANKLNPNIGRTHTVLGFAYLTRIKIQQATTSFNNAIEKDQADPLARLGLGLAIIRQGNLEDGRREIEYATTLDPNNALIRSYLGKAYYEEKRNKLAAVQFKMAKALDPNDPTAYLYDAIRKQSKNNPANALKDIVQSIKLNDNRAVYRSKLQLDQDEAARSVSLANIYQDLGFEQIAINKATNSLTNDPNNYSAHRFLADTYEKLPRHEIALASELWQSQLNQPAIINPPKPQRLSTATNITHDTQFSVGQNEYSSLLYQDGTKATVGTTIGSNGTKYNNLIISGKYGINSYSLSNFHYKTDGYRINNDFEQNLLNFSAQSNITANDKVLFSYTKDKTNEGDIDQSIIPNNESTSWRRTKDNKINQLAYIHKFSLNNHLFLSATHQNDAILRTRTTTTNISSGTNLVDDSRRTINDKSDSIEGKFNGTAFDSMKYSLGIGNFSQHTLDDENRVRNLVVTGVGTFPQSPINTNLDYMIRHKNIYLYTNFKSTPQHDFSLGISADDYEDNDTTATYNKTSVNPKLGYTYQASKNTQIRVAAFKVLKRAFIGNQTIEPTQVAGFNQLFDDLNGSISERVGLAIDHKFKNNTNLGFEFSKRDIKSPSETTTINGKTLALLSDRNEKNFKSYFYWPMNNNFIFSITPNIEKQERSFTAGLADNSRASKIDTTYIPINIKYIIQSGITASLTSTHIDQDVEFPATTDTSKYNSKAWITDFAISYDLPKRNGNISVIVKNLTNNKTLFHSQGLDSQDRPYSVIPETTYFLNVNLNF